MLERPPIRLERDNLIELVTRTFFCLVLVRDRPGIHLHPGVRGRLEQAHPDLVGFGSLNRLSIPHGPWWTETFRTATGPLKPRGERAEVGYHLFEQGLVTGVLRVSDVDFSPSHSDRVVAYFLEIMGRRAPASDPGGVGVVEPSPVAPARPPAASLDPYAVLEITEDATDEEVHDAWLLAIKLSHPDRVSHMSRAIQEFAREQTVLIQAAYQSIRTARKRRG